jgi:hypothetical protein
MVTRKSSKTAKSKNLVDTSMVKALDPRDIDTKYVGPEPLFMEESKNRNSDMIAAFNWYSRFYGRKKAKEMMIQYLDLSGNQGLAKVIRKVEESNLNPTMCWLARMTLRGFKLNPTEQKRLTDEINRLVMTVQNPKIKESTTGKKAVVKKETNRPNVQEIMKEKAREAAGEIEGMYDDYILAGAKSSFNFKPVDLLAKYNVLPQHINIVTDAWKRKRNEIEEVIKGKDAQLVQSYNHYTKTQLKNILKFIDQFLSDFNSYVSVKKATKAPRKRKVVPVEKQVAKMKFLKEFKDTATKLDLVSLHPVKLHGASECYLYDTAKRKLIYMVADEYSKTFSVKGTTLLGFDNVKSQTKTLRKPAEQIAQILKLGKPAGRKYFNEIRAVATTPNGRTNDNMIILKAW